MVLVNFLTTTSMFLYFAPFGMNNFHFTIFTMINDETYQWILTGPLQIEHVSLLNFFIFCIVVYAPFNLVKAAYTTIIGLIIADRIVYLAKEETKGDDEQVEHNTFSL